MLFSKALAMNTKFFKNLVTNGDFSRGATGWGIDGISSITVANNIASFTPTVAYGGIVSNTTPLVNGHMYYLSLLMKTVDTSACCFILQVNSTNIPSNTNAGSNNYEKLSLLVLCTQDSPNAYIKPQTIASSNFSNISVEQVIMVDISNLSAEKQTKVWCDANININSAQM